MMVVAACTFRRQGFSFFTVSFDRLEIKKLVHTQYKDCKGSQSAFAQTRTHFYVPSLEPPWISMLEDQKGGAVSMLCCWGLNP